MSSISAGTTTGTALVSTGDTSGNLELQSSGTTKLTVSSAGVTLASALPVASGGTGATSLTANNVILGNGTSAVQAVAPGTNGNVLTSNGTTWTSSAPPTSPPGGSSGQLQYNNAGAFGGVSSGTSGQILTSAGAGTAPTWKDPTVNITANSAGPYLPGNAYTWQVTNLDTYVSYSVAAIGAGTCTINTSTGVITYTPSAGGSGFTLNGRTISISVATVPDAPTIGTATLVGTTGASVTFTPPASTGGSPITGYTVTSSPGSFTATGGSSPISISGLATNTTYTFTVVATNAVGNSSPSAASNSITTANVGQNAYTSAGTYTWVAPAGITSVSALCVGAGGGGGAGGGTYGGHGGGLVYKNNITVTPGNSYTVVVGAPGTRASTTGGNSSFTAAFGTMTAGGGQGFSNYTANSGTYDAGYVGGNGGYGGGGAAGYAGAGAAGASNSKTYGNAAPTGSGGGGGGAGGAYTPGSTTANGSGAGGGVGLLGLGADGAAGYQTGGVYQYNGAGGGGSGGASGGSGDGYADPCGTYTYGSGGNGGAYGGGSGGYFFGYTGYWGTGSGGVGAVRLIWPATGTITRSFPSTNTNNIT